METPLVVADMTIFDRPQSYGWVSIVLHWISAGSVFVLWFLGDSIQTSASAPTLYGASSVHISFALGVYGLFLCRIVWRLSSGHPWVRNQGRIAHQISMFAHYLMLLALAGLLVTGPLLAWYSNIPLSFFGWVTIPSPIQPSPHIAEKIRYVHCLCGNGLMVVALLHLCGACKHLMFNDDETFVRMIFPKPDAPRRDTH